MERVESHGLIGADVPRVDGVAKVTGAARYGADQPVHNVAYAWLATSAIARGRVTAIDESEARARSGVLEILTWKNVGSKVDGGRPMLELGFMASGVAPLASNEIHFADQIVALVVAESFEIARDAALSLRFTYEVEPPTASFDSPGAKQVKAKSITETSIEVGHFDRAYEHAKVTVDARYETPAQHHNPLELFQATCVWDDDQLTVFESSQNVVGAAHGIAKQLGIAARQVRVISPYVGGAFGSRGELAQSTALVAFAARRLGRPVKLVVPRNQGFSLRTYRAETRHRIQLGADREGHLEAARHEGWELTARDDHFALAGIDGTLRQYRCPNLSGKVHNVEADRQVSGFMRAPAEWTYCFAFESAMDELAYALKLDPIELRRRNETSHEPVKGLPFSSRGLIPCFDEAARVFGWSGRPMEPRSMREGDWRVGWGCATAIYPTQIAPAHCRVTLDGQGHVTVETSASDLGTGAYTIFAQTAGDVLHVPLDHVTVKLGDSALPAAPLSAGSNTTASVTTAVARTSLSLLRKLTLSATRARGTPLFGVDPESIVVRGAELWSGSRSEPLSAAIARAAGASSLAEDTWNVPDGAPPVIGPLAIGSGRALLVGATKHKHHVQFAFGAQLVEVRVHVRTGEIRVPRMVGAFAAGRIMNPRTAKSQLTGAQIWGMASALLEATEVDRRTARYVNADLAEYHVAVQADVGEVTTLILPETDVKVNPMGVKGLGELGIVGVNAAIANGVFHATGVRLRSLPLRLDSLVADPEPNP